MRAKKITDFFRTKTTESCLIFLSPLLKGGCVGSSAKSGTSPIVCVCVSYQVWVIPWYSEYSLLCVLCEKQLWVVLKSGTLPMMCGGEGHAHST